VPCWQSVNKDEQIAHRIICKHQLTFKQVYIMHYCVQQLQHKSNYWY